MYNSCFSNIDILRILFYLRCKIRGKKCKCQNRGECEAIWKNFPPCVIPDWPPPTVPLCLPGLLKVAFTCSVSILTAGLGMAALNGDNKAVSPLARDSSMLPSGQSTAMIAVIIGTYVPCDLSRSICSMVPGGLPAYDYYFELASVQ